MPTKKHKFNLKKKNLSKLVGGAGAGAMSEEVLSIEDIDRKIALIYELISEESNTTSSKYLKRLLDSYESKKKELKKPKQRQLPKPPTTHTNISKSTRPNSTKSSKRSLPERPNSKKKSISSSSGRQLPTLPVKKKSQASFVKLPLQQAPAPAPAKPLRQPLKQAPKETSIKLTPRAGIPIPDLPPHNPQIILPNKPFIRRKNEVKANAINSMYPEPIARTTNLRQKAQILTKLEPTHVNVTPYIVNSPYSGKRQSRSSTHFPVTPDLVNSYYSGKRHSRSSTHINVTPHLETPSMKQRQNRNSIFFPVTPERLPINNIYEVPVYKFPINLLAGQIELLRKKYKSKPIIYEDIERLLSNTLYKQYQKNLPETNKLLAEINEFFKNEPTN